SGSRVGAKADGVRASAVVELEVGETGDGLHPRDGVALTGSLELGKVEGAVRCDAGYAAVLKLYLGTAIASGFQVHVLRYGHVGMRLIENDPVVIQNLNSAFYVADADRPNIIRVLGVGD